MSTPHVSLWHLCVYFWLCWVFIAGFSLAGGAGAALWLQSMGFSLWGLLSLQARALGL